MATNCFTEGVIHLSLRSRLGHRALRVRRARGALSVFPTSDNFVMKKETVWAARAGGGLLPRSYASGFPGAPRSQQFAPLLPKIRIRNAQGVRRRLGCLLLTSCVIEVAIESPTPAVRDGAVAAWGLRSLVTPRAAGRVGRSGHASFRGTRARQRSANMSLENREGSFGGSSVQGGGCGCN